MQKHKVLVQYHKVLIWNPISDVSLSFLRRVTTYIFDQVVSCISTITFNITFNYTTLNFWWQNFLDFFLYTADINVWGPPFFQDSEGTITSVEINDI